MERMTEQSLVQDRQGKLEREGILGKKSDHNTALRTGIVRIAGSHIWEIEH